MPQFNIVGVRSLVLDLAISTPLAFEVFGPQGQTLTPFVSAILGLALPSIIASLSKGNSYRVQSSALLEPGHEQFLLCSNCKNQFESTDMVKCPFVSGTLCSVCCASESKCHDMCKKSEKIISY